MYLIRCEAHRVRIRRRVFSRMTRHLHLVFSAPSSSFYTLLSLPSLSGRLWQWILLLSLSASWECHLLLENLWLCCGSCCCCWLLVGIILLFYCYLLHSIKIHFDTIGSFAWITKKQTKKSRCLSVCWVSVVWLWLWIDDCKSMLRVIIMFLLRWRDYSPRLRSNQLSQVSVPARHLLDM